MFDKIQHIGYLVRDLDAAVATKVMFGQDICNNKPTLSLTLTVTLTLTNQP